MSAAREAIPLKTNAKFIILTHCALLAKKLERSKKRKSQALVLSITDFIVNRWQVYAMNHGRYLPYEAMLMYYTVLPALLITIDSPVLLHEMHF